MVELNNIIFTFLLAIFGYFFTKYILLFFERSKNKFLVDNQFSKPQAFHENPTYRLGGVLIFFLLLLVFLYLYFFKNIFLPEYLSFCTLFFLLGLTDDLKADIRPKFRLLFMVSLLAILITYNKIHIERSGLEFLNDLLEIDIFSLIFITLCFLFIINGSNLIDGFNGLLTIHSLIILTILLFVNLLNGNSNLAYILFYMIISNLIFLKFNFPKARMFLGDGGAYLTGTFIAISIISTNNINLSISPFFFCILLFYLFFEVFFSFFRKLLFTRQSPLLPDSRHLHMLVYKILLKKRKKKSDSNYLASVYVNLIYFFSIIPAIFFINNGLFCRYYFFSLLIIYIYLYKILYNQSR